MEQNSQEGKQNTDLEMEWKCNSCEQNDRVLFINTCLSLESYQNSYPRITALIQNKITTPE